MKKLLLIAGVMLCCLPVLRAQNQEASFEGGIEKFFEIVNAKIDTTDFEGFGDIELYYKISEQGEFIVKYLEQRSKRKNIEFLKNVNELFFDLPKWTPELREGKPVATIIYVVIFSVMDRGFTEPRLSGTTFKKLLTKWGKSFKMKEVRYKFEFTVTKDGRIEDITIESSGEKNPELEGFLLTDLLKLKGITPAIKEGVCVDYKVYEWITIGDTKDPNRHLYYDSPGHAKFQNGTAERFRTWVFSRIKYPEMDQMNNVQGEVLVHFIIGKDGELGSIILGDVPSSSIGSEVLRVVLSSPKWTPGMKDGIPIRVSYNLPVQFRIQ